MVWPLQDSLNTHSAQVQIAQAQIAQVQIAQVQTVQVQTVQVQTVQVASQWSDAVVRDTIAAIARQSEYQRDLGQSALNKFLRWMWDRLEEVAQALKGLPHGREIALALLVLVVLLIVARIVIGVRAEERANRVVARGLIASGRDVSLAEAERLAIAGDFTGAAHVLFSSLLMVGAARGQFRVHPSKTTGDYARDLRRKRASWLSPFHSFRSRYDRVIYGDMQCSADDYAALLHDARTMLAPERAA